MQVLIITGAPGVGKSETAIAWAKRKEGVVIPVDYLSNWVYDKAFPKWNEEAEKFLAQLSAKMAIEYLSMNLPVVIDYVWTPMGIQIIQNDLSVLAGVQCHSVWLTCNSIENRRRDALRKPDHQMKERVNVVRMELEDCTWAEEVQRVDSSSMSVEEVIKEIAF